MNELEGKTIIVTGAGRGIGRAIAREMARNGARIALVAQTVDQIEETRTLVGNEGGVAIAVPADITDAEAVAAMIARVEKELGAVDVLMNSAGRFNAIGPVWEIDPEDWWRDISVNLLGTMRCVRAVLPSMMRRRSGIIINMIGGGTAGPLDYGSGYGSSKAAVMRFTETIADELGFDSGIQVFAMDPGLVRTAMTELQLQTQAGKKWMTKIEAMFRDHRDHPPEDAAHLAAALASGKYAALHGRALYAGEDPDKVMLEIDAIRRDALRTLRMRR
ncbi:MAG TPA: SDR family oxidoreductase [Spirochaetia bacterium]|nr:SDR family oxidoreductase [Spirochaetia bacterium]